MIKLHDLQPVEGYFDYQARQTTWLSRLLCQSRIMDDLNQANYYQGGARNKAFTLAYWHDSDKVAVDLAGIEQPTLEALQELLELSQKHHFKLAIGRQATLMKKDQPEVEVPHMWRILRWKYQGKCITWESFFEGRRLVVDAQACFAEQHHIPYIDTEAQVPKTTEYFVDDAHTFENGADRISDSFADGLIKTGILDELLGRDSASAKQQPGR